MVAILAGMVAIYHRDLFRSFGALRHLSGRWFVLAAASLLFVAIDIRATPESPVMKWGFVLVTAYTGVLGAFMYVLGCRQGKPHVDIREAQ